MVKLRVSGTRKETAAMAEGRKKDAMPESDLGWALRQLLGNQDEGSRSEEAGV